ncbi:nicolin-1 isoform X1 [Chrysemys picta bellii]|uniref:nicolin-1 isoform X1 n=1 Tax=Chrysemys picta bellii TaxID=8478 RepID=UPI001C671A3C|nr:nicolin-1 isoform X1 [Chrysemys picta bellii]
MEPPAPNPGHGAGRPMATRPAPCTVRSPVALQVGDVKTDLARPGVAVIDVALPPAQPLDLQEIVFKNSYTAFLTVRVQRRHPCDVGRASARKWVTCLWNHCLMPSPHTEAGSQDYFSLFRHQLLCDVDQVTAVRLILRQPSPVWLHFTLEELRLYPRGQQSLQTDFPSWLSHLAPQQQPENLHGIQTNTATPLILVIREKTSAGLVQRPGKCGCPRPGKGVYRSPAAVGTNRDDPR